MFKLGKLGRYRFTLVVIILILLWQLYWLSNNINSNIDVVIENEKIIMIQEECRILDWPLHNPETTKFNKSVEKIDCGNSLDDWVKCEKSKCFVKPEVTAKHGEIICAYTDLLHASEYAIKYGNTTKTKEFYILEKSDFVKVVCSAKNGISWTGTAYGIRNGLKPQVLDTWKQAHKYNVLMFGFGSLSRNAFIRKLPKSYAYLKEQLNAVVLNGYNAVGDDTTQTLLPLITGYSQFELPNTHRRIPSHYDVNVYPMIWMNYARHGYVTSFNEDATNIGTFAYRLSEFSGKPIDHYLRTLYLNEKDSWNLQKENCIGHQPEHVVMLDYTKNFMAKYNNSPRFVFSFYDGLSHDSTKMIGAADDDTHKWLKDLKEQHLLDNTILIFMSNHGNGFSEIRATVQGKAEERLPFFSFAFPKSFRKRYPQHYANLVENANRLTTAFDVHATLEHILVLQTSVTSIDIGKDLRAISLFTPVPKSRSCFEANIELHLCICMQWQELSLDNTIYAKILHKIATNMLQTINEATISLRNFCQKLELYKINWALRLIPNKKMLISSNIDDPNGIMLELKENMSLVHEVFALQIVANPGGAIFEATVTYNRFAFNLNIKLSHISRINYGMQGNCIKELNLKLQKYCQC